MFLPPQSNASKAKIVFFGTHEEGWVPHKGILPYTDVDPSTVKIPKQKSEKLVTALEECGKYVDNIRKIAKANGSSDPTAEEL